MVETGDMAGMMATLVQVAFWFVWFFFVLVTVSIDIGRGVPRGNSHS